MKLTIEYSETELCTLQKQAGELCLALIDKGMNAVKEIRNFQVEDQKHQEFRQEMREAAERVAEKDRRAEEAAAEAAKK